MYQDSLESFSQVRAETIALIENLSQRQLDYKPSPRTWSVGEVMDHLFLAERFFRSQIELLVEQQRSGRRTSLALSFRDLNVRPAFVPGCLLPLFEIPLTITNMLTPRSVLQLLLATPLGRARHPDAADPRASLSKEQLVTQLTQGLAETREIFEQNPLIDFGRLRISHPLLGDNSVVELLDVMTTHERGHQQKVRQSIGRLPGQLEPSGHPLAPLRSQHS